MDFFSFNQLSLYTKDFYFRELNDNNKNAIVIFNPIDSMIVSPVYFRSEKSLEDHITHICKNNIKKAIIIAENIEFIRQCPSLEYLMIFPSITAKEFDFSPIYDMPKIKWLNCQTMYGIKEDKVAYIDYSRINGLQSVTISGKYGHQNLARVRGLKSLFFYGGQPDGNSLEDVFDGKSLEELEISQSSIRTLSGLNAAGSLQTLSLAYNRRLEDISDLHSVKKTIVSLKIENCGKIKDFSVLYELHNLEELRLVGSNKLPDLNFINNMPKLKVFVFMMNSENGDLSMCERIPYVEIKNHKHYSHKDKDFKKEYIG